MDFTAAHPEVNRIELLMDVTNGLMHMHIHGLIHGDLKGVNILINQTNRACITDFGLSAVAYSGVNKSTSSLAPFTPGGTYRWMSPELLIPDKFGMTNDRPTRRSDCYALGMVIYEVLSGYSPYHKLNKCLAIAEILNGGRPKEPRMATRLGFTGGLWKTMEGCWDEDRNKRPDLGVVLAALSDAVPSWEKRKSKRMLLASALREVLRSK